MPKYRLALSNANLPPAQAALYTAEQHLAIMHQTSADGMELLIMRSLLMAQMRHGLGHEALSDLVTTVHQPYRRQTASEALRSANPTKIKEAIGMPRVDKSLDPIARVQTAIGRLVPVVVYPNEQIPPGERLAQPINYHMWHGVVAQTRWQVTAEALAARERLYSGGVTALAGIRKFNSETGIDKTVFDSKHSTDERGGYALPPWQQFLPLLVRQGQCVEFHMGPARTDVGGDTSQLSTILNGHMERTEIGDMLVCIRENALLQDNDTYFDVVNELPFQALAHADVGSRYYIDVNQEVIASAREILHQGDGPQYA